MGLGTNTVPKFLKPLYGIPERGLQWYLTYIDHHTEHLGMKGTTVDPCFMFKRECAELVGMIDLQVDDSSSITKKILQEEEDAEIYFRSKERKFISLKATPFNGIQISKMNNGNIHINQLDNILKLRISI